MQKLKLIVALLLVMTFSSCHFGHGSTVIVENNGDFSLRIEYSGRIKFTDDSTAIKFISHNGYVRFKANGKKLEAEKKGDKIVYRLNDEIETSTPTGDDKKFVADAIHEIMKRGNFKN